MIYLKILISPRKSFEDSAEQRGTAEFMFKGLDEETATRLALSLLRNDGWTALDLLESLEASSSREFVKGGHLKAMYDEAEADDVACVISARQRAEALSA